MVLDTVGWIAFELGKAGDQQKLDEASDLLEKAYQLDRSNSHILLHYGALLYNSDDLAQRNEGFSLLLLVKEKWRHLAREADEIIAEADKSRREMENQ